jgi:hypothetical protein
MSSIKLIDLCRFYKGLPYQMAAISELEEAIHKANPHILGREQAWFKTWSQAGKQSDPIPSIPGMVGPSKRPENFGFKPGDSHILVNDANGKATAYSYEGIKRWEAPCLARGQGADNSWDQTGEDTPPGLYKLGQIYNDYQRYGVNAPCNRETLAYGWISFDLVELENQEARHGRAGVMIHGGGTGCGWPRAWAPMQELRSTQGCVRMHNIDLRDKLLPLAKTGTVFVSVYQER